MDHVIGSLKGPDANERLHDHLAQIHQWAQDVAGGGPGPHSVSGLRYGGEPTDATILRTSPDEFLESEVYGSDYGKVREAMLEAEQMPDGHPMSLNVSAYGGMEKTLARPIFEVSQDPSAKGSSYAFPEPGLALIRSSGVGYSPGATRNHEWRHLAFPVGMDAAMARGSNWAEAKSREAIARIQGLIPQGHPSRTHIEQLGKHAQYTGRSYELTANLAHMMGLEYGITGQRANKPEERIRLVQKWLEGKPKIKKNPSGPFDVFGGDPVIEYGPRAGQPAENYEFMREMFRNVLPGMTPEKKRDVIKAMGPLGSTRQPQVSNVA
jgi:hypothetical protein